MKQALEVFSMRLKQLREEYGLSQEAMADRIGISRVSIVNYESGKRTPDIEVVSNVSREFSVSADYLLGLSKFRDAKTVEGLITSHKKLERILNSLLPHEAERIAENLFSLINWSQTACVLEPVLHNFYAIMDQLNFVIETFNECLDAHVADMAAFHVENPVHVDSEAAADGYGCDPELLEGERELSKKIHAADFATRSSASISEVSAIISKLLKELNDTLPDVFDQTYDESLSSFN